MKQAMKHLARWALVAIVALCGCQAAPSPAGTHVMYGMSASLDSEPLPPLVTITAESCYDGYGGYTLAFSGVADMKPEAIDDEIQLHLTIQMTDISQLPLGQAVEVANKSTLQLAALATVFRPPPQGALTAATGTLTLAALSSGEMSGTASLVFSDPADVNPVVQNSLVYDVTFTNLAIIDFCREA